AALLARGDTRAIPYLHSPAVMQLMTALGTRTEAGIAIALGALRPGASTTRPRLLAALHGGTATLPDWQVLSEEHQQVIEHVLAGSHGAFLFDEDLLLVAHALGLSLADAERLRKALKKGGEQATRLSNHLRAAALENGWSDAEIDVVLGWLHYIQRYTFVRGHALALAHIAWRVAYLAAHYPVHFHAAVLDRLGEEGGGMYPQLVYATEARRHGITLVGPSVNSPLLSLPHKETIRCGLRVLCCALSMPTLERIHAESQVRPFTSVTDLRTRVKLTASEMDKLISAGALDTVTTSRRAARWEAARARRELRDQPRLIADEDAVPVIAIEHEPVAERAAEEYRTLGWTVSLDHPLDLYVDQLARQTITPAERIGEYVGQEVVVAGVVVAYRRIRTQQGRPMVFASLCDARAVVELTLFEQAAQQYSSMLKAGGVMLARGTVQRDDERGVGVIAHAVRSLDER
ncbi:MAG: OB-fold nucleic acid binding domain-containing protein, partial [Chloroflexota bacterium]|nr:OB-fold nucleic acid binding domain-containing protein [Chloroflexota bacterium]